MKQVNGVMKYYLFLWNIFVLYEILLPNDETYQF